jgi:endonuclease YncB( thermonuclease family)
VKTDKRLSSYFSNKLTVPYLAFALIIFLPLSVAFADVTGKPRIIDGDTVEIAGERIRLHGIDTPETNQICLNAVGKQWRCGREATLALAAIVGDQSITCKGDERDRYKRLIAVCFAGAKDLNSEMVRRGWALAYRKYSTDYVAQEGDAKSAKIGLWRGQFVAPWDWRRGKRLASEAQKTCCKICRKGKACGNSCIRRTYTCRKQPGCACDAR